MRAVRALPLALAACLLAGASGAHDSEYGFLRLRVEGRELAGEWELHLRDARLAVGLPAPHEGPEAWAGLRARAGALVAHLARRLAFRTPAGPCETTFEESFRDAGGDRNYALGGFRARCPAVIGRLAMAYDLVFDLDPRHRGFFAVEDAHQTHVGAFTAEQRQVEFDVRQLDRWRTLADYLRAGTWHIWSGADHVLFLVVLLLPSVLRDEGGRWQPASRPGPVLAEVLRVVTAFTVAHSLTLALAVLGVLRLPSRWVEAAIATSVLVAAWNNVRPFLRGRIWTLAFGFGLVHGLGFAGVLMQLGLPRQARGLALFGFNAGVELGQLAIVGVLLPLLYAARGTPAYQKTGVPFGSLLVAWVAAIWLIERLLQIDLIPLL